MCDDGEFELDWGLNCRRCGKNPAVDLQDSDWGNDAYDSLCESCGIEIFGESVVSDWAGTELYLKKYPDQVDVWR